MNGRIDQLPSDAVSTKCTVWGGWKAVRAFCFGDDEHPDSPKNANVPPGGHVNVTFNSCD